MPLAKILKDGSETGGTAADKINLAFDVADKNESDIKNVALKYKGLYDITTPAPAVLDIGDTYIASSNGTFDASWGMPPAETASVGTWLMWNGAGWVYISSGTFDVSSLTGIDLTNQALGDGDTLTYNLTNQTFEVHTPTISDGSDVTITTPANDEVIMWNGTGWVNASITLSAIDDMDLTNLGDGVMLIYNNTTKKFEVTSPVDTFTSAANVGKPVVTNANGKVDSSLIDMNALVFKGTVDVTAVDTVTTPNIGDLYFNTTAGNWDASWGQGTGPAVENEAIVWDGSDWVHLGPMTSIQNLGGLADVAYGGALGEGDYLSYDATNSLWVKSSAPSVDALTDVDVTAKGDGKIVAWDQTSGKYVFVDNTHAFDDLTDVDVTAKGDGKLIVWDQASGKYVFTAKVNDFGDLSDITVTTPTNGQVLTYDLANGKWVNLDLPPTAQPATTIGAMTDTNLTGMTNGQVLTYDLANGKWVNLDLPATAQPATTVDALTDTNLTGITDGQIMVYDLANTEWVNQDVPTVPPIPSDIEDLDNVTLTTPANDDILRFDTATGQWVNKVFPTITSTLAALTDTNITALADGQGLIFDNTAGEWVNKDIVNDIDDLGDVTITTPTDGHTLIYDATATEWLNRKLNLGELGDVDLTNLANGSMLVRNATSGNWEIVAPINSFGTVQDTNRPILTNNNGKLDSSLLDINAVVFKGSVDMTAPDALTNNSVGDLYFNTTDGNWDASWGQGTGPVESNEAIVWDGVAWVHLGAMSAVETLASMTDVVYGKVLEQDDYLVWDLANGQWIARKSPTVASLEDTNIGTLAEGEGLVWDDTAKEWVNRTILPDATNKAGHELATRGAQADDAEWSPFRTTPNLIDTDYTIEDNVSASIVSPTIKDGVIITIPDGSTLVIL